MDQLMNHWEGQQTAEFKSVGEGGSKRTVDRVNGQVNLRVEGWGGGNG